TPVPPAAPLRAWADAAIAAARAAITRQSGDSAAERLADRRGTSLRGAMLFLHEVHDVVGGKMDEFGAAVRDEWRPLVEEHREARLLWFWHLTHGTGPSYQAVSITAVRDWQTWGKLVDRSATDPRFVAWRRRVWTIRREVTAKLLTPVAWSPLQEVDLAAAAPASDLDAPAMYLHDTG